MARNVINRRGNPHSRQVQQWAEAVREKRDGVRPRSQVQPKFDFPVNVGIPVTHESRMMYISGTTRHRFLMLLASIQKGADMQYHINHVHVRAQNPEASAAWYEKHFNAKKLWAREIMPGTVTVSMEVGGPVRLNISSKPAGTSDERSVAELNRLGLEHFGFDVEDLESELARLRADGIRVVLPLTSTPTGSRLAYIEGPDDVLIELVQPAR